MKSGASGSPLRISGLLDSEATASPPTAPPFSPPAPQKQESAAERVAKALQILIAHVAWADAKRPARALRYDREDVEAIVRLLSLALEQLERDHADRVGILTAILAKTRRIEALATQRAASPIALVVDGSDAL